LANIVKLAISVTLWLTPLKEMKSPGCTPAVGIHHSKQVRLQSPAIGPTIFGLPNWYEIERESRRIRSPRYGGGTRHLAISSPFPAEQYSKRLPSDLLKLHRCVIG